MLFLLRIHSYWKEISYKQEIFTFHPTSSKFLANKALFKLIPSQKIQTGKDLSSSNIFYWYFILNRLIFSNIYKITITSLFIVLEHQFLWWMENRHQN